MLQAIVLHELYVKVCCTELSVSSLSKGWILVLLWLVLSAHISHSMTSGAILWTLLAACIAQGTQILFRPRRIFTTFCQHVDTLLSAEGLSQSRAKVKWWLTGWQAKKERSSEITKLTLSTTFPRYLNRFLRFSQVEKRCKIRHGRYNNEEILLHPCMVNNRHYHSLDEVEE